MFLVTGGTGFIGSHLLESLAASGEPVRALMRREAALPHGVEPSRGDLHKGEGLESALRGVETVIHLAGATKALNAAGYYEGNARTTEMLARAVTGRNIRLVHVSSLAAAGPSLDGIPVREDDEPHPPSHYGKSKLEAERIVRRLVPQAVIVRPPVVYGPRDRGVLRLLQSVARGLVLEIGGGERRFSFIFVRDLIEGLIAAARTPQAAGRTYFLAHPRPVAWSEFNATAARIMNRRLKVVRVPAVVAAAVGYCGDGWSRITGKPGIISSDKVTEARCLCWVCDTRRAAKELGFEARTDLEAGLVKTLAWYKEAGWLTY
jgi:nucleoside-diphosphate-sugar epimerase